MHQDVVIPRLDELFEHLHLAQPERCRVVGRKAAVDPTSESVDFSVVDGSD